jgi:hypothetical protein
MTEQDPGGAKTRVDPTSWMTDRMVADRCIRMWGNAQWKRLHEFCSRDPRARTWVLSRIGALHAMAPGDAAAQKVFNGLAADRNPRLRPDGTGEVVDVSDTDVEIVSAAPPPGRAPPPMPPTTGAVPAIAPGLPLAFVTARDAQNFPAAGEALLEYLRALPPGVQPAVMAVEVREVLAELAREGALRLIMDLVALLPARLTASAIHDLGEKLRIGAVLHASALRFAHAVEGREGRSAVRAAEATLLEDVRKVLQQHNIR